MPRRKKDNHIQTGRNLPNRYSSYAPGEGTDAQVEPEQKKSGWRIFRRVLLVIILIVLAAAIVLAIWDARNISSASQKMFGNGDIFSLINSSGLQTDSTGRVNMLIAGYSADDPGHSGANLTDSLIILSMDPTNHTGYMLSVPRDLYVSIPGNGHARINEAYTDGGMPLLTQVVENFTGMQIPYNALVDYGATRGIVNAVGGIDVTVNSPDGRLYDPSVDYTTNGPLVDLNNGQHHLDGQQALDFSRARGDAYGSIGFEGPEGSDFRRTTDQRQVFSAIKAKMNWKLILNPRKNSQILNAIADNVKTNLKSSEARPMFGLFNSIPNSQMQSYSFRNLNGHNYLSGYISPLGQDVLIPTAGFDDFSQIQAAITQLNL